MTSSWKGKGQNMQMEYVLVGYLLPSKHMLKSIICNLFDFFNISGRFTKKKTFDIFQVSTDKLFGEIFLHFT